MPLPELIEIVPLEKPVRAEITVPGSKSITNRALILAALADGPVTLQGALWSEDTQIMVDCLKELGFVVHVGPDPEEPCNRAILVVGRGGTVPPGGTVSEPLDLFVGNAGTVARFLAPLLCLGSGVYRLHGVPRMHERPQAALFGALRELGYHVESDHENDRLPARIFSEDVLRPPESQTEFAQRRQVPPVPRQCHVSIAESSQFASALLLSAETGGWNVEIEGENAEESPYVVMTAKLIEAFPKKGGTFQIEPDASSGSYFWAAHWLVSVNLWMNNFLEKNYPHIEERFPQVWEWVKASRPGGTPGPEGDDPMALNIRHWPISGWQIDADFPQFIPLPDHISREGQLGDSIMTAIVLAADLWAGVGLEKRDKGIRFTELDRLRLQECDRVAALKAELTKCGAKIDEAGNALTVFQTRRLHGAEIETYHDHRLAMCFAILGLKVPDIRIKNPACVKKTFPNFFQKLAAAPPHGLGAEIWEIKDGQRARRLAEADLFAD
ncbi:MAG: 3-phosphoshikimate 1-carboxyvinyltransferase [Verrucomicrobiota bacterium]|jgi:3-phosphoshikimate 1-carboxyvinyltransferase